MIELITAISTALAAVFAAFSAWTSRQSAKAARDAVEEARLARRAELAPQLVLEQDFFDLRFCWLHPDGPNGVPAFLSRKDQRLIPATFTLRNFGQKPALDVTIEWELDDPNGEYSIPEYFAETGISVQPPNAALDMGQSLHRLRFARSDRSSVGLPLYRKCTTDVPSCSIGQRRSVEFPIHILNVLFLRGLQRYSAHGKKGEEMVLSVCISCYSVDGERYERTFKWTVIPFSQGELRPVVVYGHFLALAVHPKPPGPRVA